MGSRNEFCFAPCRYRSSGCSAQRCCCSDTDHRCREPAQIRWHRAGRCETTGHWLSAGRQTCECIVLAGASSNAPFTTVGGINGRVGGIGIAPGVPNSAVDATAAANKSFQAVFQSGGAPCAGLRPGASICPLAVNLNTFPSGTLKTPYFLQWSIWSDRELGAHGSLRWLPPQPWLFWGD